MGVDALPDVYRDLLEVVADAPGPVRAKQIVPRIGLPVDTAKIEGTRAKLKRLVGRGWLDEDSPGLFTLSRARMSAYSSECTTEYRVMCTTGQATSASRSMACRRFFSR
jgi:hypothetical protein